MGWNPGISILIDLAKVARHIDLIGNDAISSLKKHLEKMDQEWLKKKTQTNYFI